VVMQARILSLLLKAAKLGGIADSTELMRNAGQLFLELQDGTSDHAAEKTLILARANVAFADFANSRSQAISALQVLLKQLEHGATELNELSIKDLRESLLVVQRIYTLYYLGILHGMNGDHAKARPFLEQVIQLDPASNFAEFAYQSLGQLER
jgi:tetratricopeptide (TPR) repeat protein